ncbi:GFA family protein [Myxococcus virescens]|uniref:GFA family protein n=1 Tax=Myxococcus virescens TaxID=83456 RepID=UPI003DA5A9D8
MTHPPQLGCACGKVLLQVRGVPIISAECCCNSCRAAGARLQTLPGARPVLSSLGATRFVLYRKDRVHFQQGTEHLNELRLTPEAKTRRVVATCCNTPVFLEFEKGHWLSLYGALWPEGTLPPLELRTMTSDLPAGTVLPEDVPNGKHQSVSFFVKLLGAWVLMGFRSPKLAVVHGQLQV